MRGLQEKEKITRIIPTGNLDERSHLALTFSFVLSPVFGQQASDDKKMFQTRETERYRVWKMVVYAELYYVCSLQFVQLK